MKTGILTKRLDKLVTPPDAHRDYIGASSIGAECMRAVWYDYTGAPKQELSARTRRILDTGHILEDYVITLLERTGMIIERASPDNNFHEYAAREQPYFKGHFDGIIRAPSSLVGILEIKTANDARYNQFVKLGLKKWSPQYYAQVQAMMGMSGFNKTYEVVINKDKSFIADELITYSQIEYANLCKRAEYLQKLTVPPPRVNESPLWHQCKMCKFREICRK